MTRIYAHRADVVGISIFVGVNTTCMPSSHRFVPSHWIRAAIYRVNSGMRDSRTRPSTSHHFEKLLFILLKCKKWQERR